MTAVHVAVGLSVIALNAAAGGLGAWSWWRLSPTAAFWPLLRAAQVAVVVQAALGGVLVALGRHPADDLHYVYGLLPLAVAFIAEQARAAAAETVLDARDLESAQAVGGLPPREQRLVVEAIVRREVGVMALSALAITGLALRAAFGT
jgi:hypothetical protein